MAQQQQWIEIDEVVNAYLSRAEQSRHKYFKCWQLAFSGMQEMGIDIFYTIKSIKLAVNANFTVNLPGDYLNWSKVAVLNAVGDVIPLTYNDTLTTYADTFPNRVQDTDDFTLSQGLGWSPTSPVFCNYWNGLNVTPIFGVPSGAPFVGNWKIDNENGLIVLDQNFYYTYIILEYLASPQEGCVYRIPVQFREALIAYIGWQDIQYLPNTRKGTSGDKEMRKRLYYNERRHSLARYKPIRLPDAYNEWITNQKYTVRS
jgi:hypothetical protein